MHSLLSSAHGARLPEDLSLATGYWHRGATGRMCFKVSPPLLVYNAAVALIHSGSTPSCPWGLARLLRNFLIKCLQGGSPLSSASDRESHIYTCASAPPSPVYHPSASRVHSRPRQVSEQDLGSLWTSPTEVGLWDGVWEPGLASHYEAPLVPRYHSSKWCGHWVSWKSEGSPRERTCGLCTEAGRQSCAWQVTLALLNHPLTSFLSK